MTLEELYKNEQNIEKAPDGHWYYTPGKLIAKICFLICSIAIFALGCIFIWDPAARYLFGEQGNARISQIQRFEPGREPELIRYRKEILEGGYYTRFTYTATINLSDGSSKKYILAIGSLKNAFANINDRVEIIYFPSETHAYQLNELRTWSFGVGFLFVGLLLTICAVPTVLAVGKPILIDEETTEVHSANVGPIQ